MQQTVQAAQQKMTRLQDMSPAENMN